MLGLRRSVAQRYRFVGTLPSFLAP